MSDLISRADAIERIVNDNVVGGMKRINEYRDSTEHNDYLDGISTAIATVDDLPSADAVEVDRTSEWVAVRREEYEELIADAEQVTGKLKKPCDSLLTEESNGSKEHKSKLESADAVHGEWVDVENEPYCECSVCGSYIDNLDDNYAFCPRCGARMKGGDDE